MGTRVEQPGELVPCAGRAGCRDLEDLADPLHRLPPAAKDLQVIVQSRNRTLLLQGTFCITLHDSIGAHADLGQGSVPVCKTIGFGGGPEPPGPRWSGRARY